MASSMVKSWEACNRFVAHFNAFTSIAIVSNLVPCFAQPRRRLPPAPIAEPASQEPVYACEVASSKLPEPNNGCHVLAPVVFRV